MHKNVVSSTHGKDTTLLPKVKNKADRLKRASLMRFANSQGWTVSVLDYTQKSHESIRNILEFWKPDAALPAPTKPASSATCS